MENISNAGKHDSFRTVQLSGEAGGKLKHCKANVEELKAWRKESVCFLC